MKHGQTAQVCNITKIYRSIFAFSDADLQQKIPFQPLIFVLDYSVKDK